MEANMAKNLVPGGTWGGRFLLYLPPYFLSYFGSRTDHMEANMEANMEVTGLESMGLS